MTINWNPLSTLIAEHDHFIVSSHIRPDADALGSEMAFAIYLEQIGKKVRIVNPGQSPKHLMFLDPEEKVVTIGQVPADVLQTAQIHFVLDTCSWKQLSGVGDAMKTAPSKKVVIDHHISGDDLSAVEFKDVTEPATGCLVYQYLTHVGADISAFQALCMFAAISTDTGWFRFPATKPSTYRIAAELMELGVNPQDLYTLLYEQASLARLKLSGIVLQRVQVAFEGKVAFTFVAQKDLAETGSHPTDTENFVNECLKISGVKIAFICVEQQNRSIKTSFRSRVGSNVAKLAETFGGGGHKQASGAVLNTSLDEAIKQILDRISSMDLSEADDAGKKEGDISPNESPLQATPPSSKVIP